MLDLLDELGIADDTFVMYSTDNGPHRNSWPDGGMTPFRSEKNTNWEGAFRIPMVVRWPGKIKAGRSRTRSSSTTTGSRRFSPWPAIPTSSRSSRSGYQAIGRTYKNHIDGYNLLPYLTGKAKESPRKVFMYISDDGDILGSALRQLEGRVHGAALPRHACRCGPSRSRGCGCRSSSTCGPIRTSSRTSTSEHLLRVAHTPHLRSLRRAGDRAASSLRHVQGLPADPEAEHLHDRRCDQAMHGARPRWLTRSAGWRARRRPPGLRHRSAAGMF